MTEKDVVSLNNNESSKELTMQNAPPGEGPEGLFSKSPQNKNEEKDYRKVYSLKNLIDFVKYPVITEKTATAPSSTGSAKNTQYTFDVDKRLTKPQIKKLFESVFNINVVAVNTHIPPRKTVRVGTTRGFRPSFKRAIITCKPNQTINFISKSTSTT